MNIRNLTHHLRLRLEQFRAILIPDTFKKLKRCDVLLCCHDANRGETLEGLAYSRLLDSVAEELMHKGLHCAQFAFHYNVLVGAKAWGRPVSVNRRRFLNGFILFLLRRFKHLRLLDFGKVVAYQEQHEQHLYAQLLELTDCRCVVAINAAPALCQVARRKRIPVVELLHGIGYTPVPWGWGTAAADGLPTKILSLDDVSTKTFSTLKHKGIEVRQIPHPWFKRFVDPALRQQLPAEWRVLPSWMQTDRKIVMVTFQWGFSGEIPYLKGILPNGLIHDELIRTIELTPSVLWLLRLHPVQLRRTYYKNQHLFISKLTKKYTNCEWFQASTLPLPLLFHKCHGHITMTSMTVYEAAFLGVPSLLLSPTLQSGGIHENSFLDLRQTGYATLGTLNAEAIAAWVRQTQRCATAFQTQGGDDWDATVEWMFQPNQST
ncbi:hypothetical protein [Candidatus Viridilinea mediisalina]|uniref:hypothetical protein n=1 Tax=Candidatus Viridilinea mediisalina TaxID=2024553 RepID=UPI000F5B597B|nr:hypothetical protein [Candidatus Viridilinea mediisalina]